MLSKKQVYRMACNIVCVFMIKNISGRMFFQILTATVSKVVEFIMMFLLYSFSRSTELLPPCPPVEQ